MSTVAVERVTDFACTLGESPVWRASEGALYWVDIVRKLIHRVSAVTGASASWRTEEMVACIAFDRRGGLVAGMETGIFALTLEGSGTTSARRLAAPTSSMQGMRFNDGKCDRQGRFWAGTMHMDIPGNHSVGGLYRYDGERGLVGPVQEGLRIQNGLAFSPTGDRMYLSDSNREVQAIWRYDFDGESGLPSNRQLFVDMHAHRGRPDGAAVDADGCYWSCAADGGCLHRFTPEGKLDRTIDVPVVKPTMCAFGGSGYETLYVTSMKPPADVERPAGALDGCLLSLRPGVRGLPEPEFAG